MRLVCAQYLTIQGTDAAGASPQNAELSGA